MRRFWSFIVLAFTALLVMGVSITAITVQADSNIEYQSGREIVFRIEDKEDKDLELEDGALEEVAEIFENRLNNAEIDAFEIAIQGTDTIKVTFSTSYAADYDNIIYYLGFNGNFALSTSSDVFAIGDEFLDEDEEVYLDTINGYPVIVIPVNEDSPEFKAVIEEGQRQMDNGEGEVTVTTNEDGEEEEEVNTYLYLWSDYQEGDIYSMTVSGNEDYDSLVEEKIIMKFSVDNGYWLDDDEDALVSYVNIDNDGDGYASVEEREYGYSQARFYVNILNSEELDYDVTYMYSRNVDAWYESVISLGSHATIAWSSTLIATLIAIVVMVIALAFVYRWFAAPSAVVTMGSMFTAIGLTIALSVEINVGAIIGLVAVMMCSCLSGVLYFSKFKEECRKGRSLRKANSEASKRSLWPMFDINLVLIIIGACCFLMGGTYMTAFASITVFGGIASMIYNIFLLRGGCWLLTNNTKWQGRYDLFGVQNSEVPDTSKGEKTTYKGPYDDKSLNKHTKAWSITTASVFAVVLIGMITFGCVYGGNLYNTPVNESATQIYVETSSTNSPINYDSLHKFFEKVYIGDADSHSTNENLDSYVAEISSYTNTIREDTIDVTYYYYIIDLTDTSINEDTTAYYFLENDGGVVQETIGYTINEVFDYALPLQSSGIADSKASVTLKDAVVNSYQPDIYPIILATSIGVIVSAVYLMFRYRPARGLASLVTTTAAGAVTIGLFSLFRVPVSALITIALPFTCIFTFTISIYLMNKDKESVQETRRKDLTREERRTILDRANSQIFTTEMFALCVSILIAICFFGFGTLSTSLLYLGIIVGCLLGAFVTVELLPPLCHLFYTWLSRIHINQNRKPKKNKKKTTNRGAEPEEVIFIGIND